jgi:alkylhydroperoxidase/carboxymuconolactone decarboxylase family protein YurZ
MAQATRTLTAIERVGLVSTTAAESFAAMRAAINEAGPLEAKYRELINIAAFATARIEGGFKTHLGRALDAGATPEEARQATLLTFGSTLGISPVTDALRWIDEVLASRS